MSENLPAPPEGNFLFYQAEDGVTRVRVLLDGGTVWLSQRLIAELYGKSVPTVNEHIKNIYDEAELDPEATIRKSRIVQTEGSRQVSRLVDLYNLDVIRASERRFYQKITDIYATSSDYDPNAPITQEFYATVQNKLHWANGWASSTPFSPSTTARF